MEFKFTEEEEQFRQEVREFLKKEARTWWNGSYWAFDPEHQYEFWEFYKKVAEKGWLAISWPKKYGGLGRSVIEQMIYNEELGYSLAPQMANGGVNSFAGEALLHHGTERQKEAFLPLMSKGKMICCEALTEPEAGSDLASLQTKAVEKDDSYIINGQKALIGGAHFSTHIWLAARTKFNVAKHKGISLFLLDTKLPGVTVAPLEVMNGTKWVCRVHFDDVVIPKENLIGEKNQGWNQLVTALNFERINFGSGATVIGCADRLLAQIVRWVKLHGRESLPADFVVKTKLAEMASRIEIGRLLCYRAVCMQAKRKVPISEASIAKVFCSELNQQLANTGMQILGLYSQLKKDSKWAQINGIVEYMYLNSIADTIGAGTSEIQRNIIAVRGLGMPKE